MTNEKSENVLAECEADNFAQLYKCRWDTAKAAEIVPLLIGCLKVEDKLILHRALLALHRIGAEAYPAIDAVMRLIFHLDPLIREVAILTLGGISFRCPERVTKPLIHAASQPETQKPALFALIGLGHSAACAADVFVSAFESRNERIRRLALRGLSAIGADWKAVKPVLLKARSDKNKQVRAAAERLARGFRDAT